VRQAMSGTIQETGAWLVPSNEGWQDYSFVIPEGSGEAIDEVGVLVEYFGRLKFLGRLFLTDFSVGGPGKVVIDPTIERQEWGGITRFTWNRGHWTLQDGAIHAHTAGDADAWTGNYYARDVVVSAMLTPLAGTSHLVVARAQGTSRFYAAGFQDGQLVILKQDHGTTVLASAPFTPEMGKRYTLEFSAKGEALSLDFHGKHVLTASDSSFAHGMAGLRLGSAGRMTVSSLTIEDLS
jgi:hypothetical protein